MPFKSRYLIKNTATAITSITHALNTAPRATGRTLDPWSDLSGSAIYIKTHIDHIGFNKMHEKPVSKMCIFELVFLLGNDFEIPVK